MKTPEQIAVETPHSITTTDNPIFLAKIDLKCLITSGASADDFLTIPKGTHLRILGCNLGKDFTMVRYNPTEDEEYDFSIDNRYLEYVSGDLGEEIE
jgi:hypothetical protein